MIKNSIEKHLYTIIILHGMSQTNNDLLDLVNYIQKNNQNIKIILPNAPIRNISWSEPQEKDISSWYDYYTRYDGLFLHDNINIHDFNEQTKRINKIIDKERKIVDSNKIIVAGISQGGTLALNIGLKYCKKIGGIIGIHTIFMHNIIDITNIQKIPIYLFSGDEDAIYNIEFQKKSFDKLKSKNIIPTKWFIENKLGHCKKSDNEFNFIIESIHNIFKIN